MERQKNRGAINRVLCPAASRDFDTKELHCHTASQSRTDASSSFATSYLMSLHVRQVLGVRSVTMKCLLALSFQHRLRADLCEVHPALFYVVRQHCGF